MSIYYQYSQPPSIDFSSSVAGSGKTHQLMRRAVELANAGDNVLVLMPTRELIAKTIQDELSRYQPLPLYTVIHGGVVAANTSVADAITEHSKRSPGVGQILFTTHAALSWVRHFENNNPGTS